MAAITSPYDITNTPHCSMRSWEWRSTFRSTRQATI